MKAKPINLKFKQSVQPPQIKHMLIKPVHKVKPWLTMLNEIGPHAIEQGYSSKN